MPGSKTLLLGSSCEETSSAFSASMGIELIPAELIPIYHLAASSREQGGYNGGCQMLPCGRALEQEEVPWLVTMDEACLVLKDSSASQSC